MEAGKAGLFFCVFYKLFLFVLGRMCYTRSVLSANVRGFWLKMDDMDRMCLVMKDGFLKAAALSPALRVADCAYNAGQIVSALQECAGRGIKLAVFPELALTGYTCGDLFFQQALQQAALQGLARVLQASEGLDLIAQIGRAHV